MGQVIELPIKQTSVKKEKASKPKKKYQGRLDDFNCAGHLVCGALIACFFAHTPLQAVIVIFCSLLPDIDHPRSTLGKYNPATRFMKHRGHCHSLVGAGLLSLPFVVFGPHIYVLAIIGSVGHLLADKLASWLPKHRKFQLKLW